MNDVQEIDVTIKPNGQVEVRVRGAKGNTCFDLTEEMERHLGGRLLDRQPCDEYQQSTQEQDDDLQIGQGKV